LDRLGEDGVESEYYRSQKAYLAWFRALPAYRQETIEARYDTLVECLYELASESVRANAYERIVQRHAWWTFNA